MNSWLVYLAAQEHSHDLERLAASARAGRRRRGPLQRITQRRTQRGD